MATLDTKGSELQYLKEVIEKRGHATLVMDVGSFGEPPFTPFVTAEEVARAASSSIDNVRALNSGEAVPVMTAGAEKIVRDLYASRKFDGIISIGGGMGSAIASAAMRKLPVGIPKFLLSSQKIVQAGIRGYVGTSDIVIMPSVADIAGLNRLTRQTLNNAAGAIVGMVESAEEEDTEKPIAFMTMVGSISRCGLKVRALLEEHGLEVIIFHSIGIGGMTLENLVKSYPVRLVVELGLNEIGNELFGGLASAGPYRLEAAGEKGIPQVVIPGNVDFINFLGMETVPERFRERNFHAHNPQATGVKLNADEMKLVGETIARKLNHASGPARVLIPTRGFSDLGVEGGVFFDPEADRVFIKALTKSLRKSIEVTKVNANINDDDFAQMIADKSIPLLEGG
jgi:uncharacterized protein (UPF0261 family)